MHIKNSLVYGASLLFIWSVKLIEAQEGELSVERKIGEGIMFKLEIATEKLIGIFKVIKNMGVT